MYVGILYGVPRRTSEVVRNIPNSGFDLSAATPLFMVLGPFALLAIITGALFLLLAVGSLLFGTSTDEDDDMDMLPEGGMQTDGGESVHAVELRGTFGLCLIFMATFVATYVLNWFLLTQLWSIGA
jgi:cytochrome c oxidase subunit 1